MQGVSKPGGAFLGVPSIRLIAWGLYRGLPATVPGDGRSKLQPKKP